MELPLNGRSYFSLVALSPGVTTGFVPAAQAGGRLGGSRGALTIAVAGGRSTWENYTLDGITNTDIDFNTYILQPSVDALQEFKVQSGIYPAEFGRALGQINVATKPGTNEYPRHAVRISPQRQARRRDLRFQLRHAAAPRTRRPCKTPYRQNQYGYTLGGPVWIPKAVQRKKPAVLHVELRGVQVPPDQPRVRHHADRRHAQRRLLIDSRRRLRSGGPELAHRDLSQYHPVVLPR